VLGGATAAFISMILALTESERQMSITTINVRISSQAIAELEHTAELSLL
jgi:hypothetical protein